MNKNRYLTLFVLISLFFITVMCIAAIIFLNELYEIKQNRDRIIHNIIDAEVVLTKLLDAESGQRGYLLTGNKYYLRHYNDALSYFATENFNEFIDQIAELNGNHLVRDLIYQKISELQSSVAIVNEKGADEAKKIFNTDPGNQLMENIRLEIDHYIREKSNFLKTSFDRSISLNNLLVGLIIACSVGALVALFAFNIFLKHESRQRSEVQHALMELTQWQKAVLNSTKQAIITLDLDERIVSFNKGAEKILGYTEEEILLLTDAPYYEGMDNSEVFEKLSKEFGQSVYNQTDVLRYCIEHSLPSQTVTWKARRKDGKIIDFERTLTPLRDEKGNVKGLVLVGSDITEKKNWERNIIDTKQAALHASESKSRFLISVSHDLRTPLNSIIGFSNLLLKRGGNLTDVQHTYLDRILDNGKQLLSLINNLLDLSKIESGKFSINLSKVKVSNLITNILNQLEGQVIGQKIKLVQEVHDNDEEPIETDVQKLSQILINLIGNAIKFTEKGTVTVRVLRDKETNQPTQIDVIDTGKGIDTEELAKIFEPFYQASNTIEQEHKGTGLGLSIVLSFAQLLGYGVRVNSQVGQGSTFSLLFNPPDKISLVKHT